MASPSSADKNPVGADGADQQTENMPDVSSGGPERLTSDANVEGEAPNAGEESSPGLKDSDPAQASPENPDNDKNPADDKEGQEPGADDAEKSMGLLDHLGELRGRLVKATLGVVVAFGVCWYFVDDLFNLLVNPLLAVLPAGTHAQYTTLPEAFFTRMEIAFISSLFVASPIIFYQIWAFVAPGLYDEEKRHIIPIAVLSALFFAGGAVFCYFIVFPFAFNFFIGYSSPEIVVTPKISDYISFVLKLIFAFGIIFEMPIFTLFLSRMGILTAKMMRRGRKYAIVGIFILAAILTPPDVVSQLLMAVPMLILYELSIGVAFIFGKKPKPPEQQETNE